MCGQGSDSERGEGDQYQAEGWAECFADLPMYRGGSRRGSSSGASERGSYGGDDVQAVSAGGEGSTKALRTTHDMSGSGGTDFSVQRLLPPPSIGFAPPELEQRHSLPPNNSSPREPGSGFHWEPLGPTAWVGYGGNYQQGSTYNHLPVPGPGQRWTANHVYSQHPMPPGYYANTPSSPFPPNTPSTPTHNHHINHESGSVTSPVDPSPQHTNENSTNIYHPANAGLYTLCQAAMMSSSLQENTNPYPNYPTNQQPPQLNLPQPRAPPPYIQYYQEPSPFSHSGSPQHPPPPPYHSMQMTPHRGQQSLVMCGPSDTSHQTNLSPSFLNRVSTNGVIQNDDTHPTPSYLPLLLPSGSVPPGRGGNFSHQQIPTGNGGVTENSNQKTLNSVHNNHISQDPSNDQLNPSSSSSSVRHHHPPNTVNQDGEVGPGTNNGEVGPGTNNGEAGPGINDGEVGHGINNRTNHLPPPYEQNQSSMKNVVPVVKSEKLNPRRHSCREQEEEEQLVMDGENTCTAEDTEGQEMAYDCEDDAGTSFVQNAEEPKLPHQNSVSGERTDEGIVATLANANAIIDDKEEGGNEAPAPQSLSNHSPTSLTPQNALYRLPPGLPPPPPSSPPPPQAANRRSKRIRTAYSQAQQDALELAFHANPYPDGFFRQKFSRQVGIPEDRIQVWFQNRRARGKKQLRTGSVSQRSQIKEQRLKANLASIARQAALITAATRGFGPSVPHLQPQLTQHQQAQQGIQLSDQQLPAQPQQGLELQPHPQTIQQFHHQPQGMEQPGHQDGSGLHTQTVEQTTPEQQQDNSCVGHENEVSTSPSSGSFVGHLQISSPFTLHPTSPECTAELPTTIAGCVNATEDPSFHQSGPAINTQGPSYQVFSSSSSTICYFPQPTFQQSNPPNTGAITASQEPHSMAHIFPPSLGHTTQLHPPLPSIHNLCPPNPSLQFPHPSAPSNALSPLLPPPFYHPYQQQHHHMALVQGGGGSSASSPSESISPPVAHGSGNGSHSAPSSVSSLLSGDGGAQQQRAGPQLQERPSPQEPTPPC